MRTVWAIVALAGCGPRGDDLGALRDDLVRLTSEVRARSEAIEAPLRHSAGAGTYVYDGTIDGVMWWEGEIDVTGVGVFTDAGTEMYDLDLVLRDVVLDEWTLDGALAAKMDVLVGPEGIEMRTRLDGKPTAGGAWDGVIAVAFTWESGTGGESFEGILAARDVAKLP